MDFFWTRNQFTAIHMERNSFRDHKRSITFYMNIIFSSLRKDNMISMNHFFTLNSWFIGLIVHNTDTKHIHVHICTYMHICSHT